MNSQYAFLDKERVPSRELWQKAIMDSGFDFELDPDLKPFEDSGYRPCRLAGKEAGFEINFDTSKETLSQFSDIAPNATCCIEFSWGGEMIECASAMVASYVLAKHFDAIVSFEGEPPCEDLEQFRKETLAIIEDTNQQS